MKVIFLVAVGNAPALRKLKIGRWRVCTALPTLARGNETKPLKM
jgi:hypothetical protein